MAANFTDSLKKALPDRSITKPFLFDRDYESWIQCFSEPGHVDLPGLGDRVATRIDSRSS